MSQQTPYLCFCKCRKHCHIVLPDRNEVSEEIYVFDIGKGILRGYVALGIISGSEASSMSEQMQRELFSLTDMKKTIHALETNCEYAAYN